MTEYNAIIIPADLNQPVRFTLVDGGLAAAQAVVGGDIEGVRAPAGCGAYCNADGKFALLAPNYRATLFLAAAAGHNINDVIAGDVLIVGVTEDGETTDVPAAVIEAASHIE